MTTDPATLQHGIYRIPSQERIVFGEPAAQALVAEVTRLGAQRVFVTATASLARLADGPLQQVQQALGTRLAGSFTTIRAHSPREDVLAAANAARQAGADLLVAVGGGSVIDATKAVQLAIWCGLTVPADFNRFRADAPGGAAAIVAPADPLRIVAVSTTLSAAEFTSLAGVTDSATRSKQGYQHPLLIPRTVILDPRATLPTPMRLLLGTGLRAVDHAVETWCAPTANMATQMHSMQGLAMMMQALPAIHAAPQALAPRLQAQLGMWQSISALAAGAGTGASHGIGYALGATFDVAHGETSCVMLPAVLRWNEAANLDRQQALMAAAGLSGGPSLSDRVARLVQGLGLPDSLQALGIARNQFDEIARRAMAYEPVRSNPRKIAGEADVLQILELAWASRSGS